MRRKEIIGTVDEFPTKASALRACEFRRSTINRETKTPRTIAELATHYREKEMTETSNKSFSTRTAYEIYLRNWIVPKWGEYSLSDVRTVAVEDWLRSITLANGSKAKIRNLMSALFNHAMRYEWVDRNPIRLVRQSAKRQSEPDVLTAEEIKTLLSKLDGVYYAMTFLAAVTGLRVSELLALKWEDVDFAAEEIRLTRAIVCQHIGPLKTAASHKPIPMDAALSAALLDWRRHCAYNQESDFVFASAEMDGKQPLWPSSAMSKHIRPAAKLAGITKHVRWHVFRHSFATILKGNGEDVKTVQESLRHADSKITLDTYTQGLMPVKRAAQRKVIEAVGPVWTQIAATTTASA
ncbi:MAG TPA: site-specific integrase [Verrucomicrobiae bacterium]|nr:site-specific integrase [Verrucomicrobiae bacterium]